MLRSVFESAQQRGLISPATDIDLAVSLLLTVGDGLMKRRALEAEFDGERELGVAMAMFRALFAGAISSPNAQETIREPR